MQELLPLPKPNCRSPSGIGYFDSFTKDQMIDYAKSAIDHYRATSNHIADMRKMVTPLAQRKIQTLLDKGEYRVIENATVLVNENGHAAIVNKGGAFYWVDNEVLAREFDGLSVPVNKDHIADASKMVGLDHIPDISNDQDIFRLRRKEKEQREAISEWLELKDKIKKSGRPPHADYWNQAIYEAENKLRLSIQD